MINVVAKIKAQAGQEGKIEQALRDAIPKVMAEEGTLSYTLSKSQSDPLLYLVLEKYKDMDTFMFHSSQDYVLEMIMAISPLLDGDLIVEMYDELA